MRLLFASVFTLGIWSSAILPVSAGWDNVFQPTLFNRQRTQSSYYYAPPAVVYSSPVVSAPVVAQYVPIVAQSPPVVAQSAPCDPCKQCQTSYSIRSYYQPVTTYETRTEMVPVTSYRTSYYYEPVTSYRYSAYYDPCNCNYTQVAVPSVSYQLREQKSPVQSWVSRCVQVPVQGYQQVNYWQPQTTCCNTTQGAPIPMTPGGSVPQFPQQMPPVTIAPNITPDAPPAISGTKTPATSAPKTNLYDQFYPPINKVAPMTPGASWQPQLTAPVPMQQPETLPPLPAPAKFDRIAVNENSQVEGRVVRNDQSPKANAKILFINASTGQRQTILANTAGRFNVDLLPGSWHVYLHGADDVPVHHSRIDVNGQQFRQVNLVSRSN